MITALKQLTLNAFGGVVTLDLLTPTISEPITNSDDLKKFMIATAGSVLVQIITTLIKHGKTRIQRSRAKKQALQKDH